VVAFVFDASALKSSRLKLLSSDPDFFSKEDFPLEVKK